MKKNFLASSAQRNNSSDDDDEIPSAGPSSPARPPTIRHQPPQSQNQLWNQRTYREFDGGWMELPKDIQNCPAGLKYLATIDRLLVCQQLELLEIISKLETKNRYMIKSITGQKIYHAQEKSGFCARNYCPTYRTFNMQILDQFGNEVIRLYRPVACDNCFCPCCLQVLQIFSPPNNFIGAIEQKWSLWIPIFAVKNGSGNTVLKIKGPRCTMSCFNNDVDFKILSGDGSQQIGIITKKWSGLEKEFLTDADYFGITFPMDLDVEMKAVMLGACFLVDYMFFED